MVERNATPSPSPSPAPSHRRGWRFWLLACLGLLLALVLLLAGGGWWWINQSDSLATTLRRVAAWLPEGQSLQAEGVTGSLRGGGRIESLQWRSPTLQVEVKQAEIRWRLRPLLSRELRLGEVHLAELRLRSTPDPQDTTPTQPLQALTLPLRIDLPFRVDRVVWDAAAPVEARELQGHYRYTGSHHSLAVNSLRWADGFYQAQVQLEGASPMALEAELKGTVQAPLPEQDLTLSVLARAHVSGTLATEAARLQVKAHAFAQDTVPTQAATPPSTTEEPWMDDIGSPTLRAQVQATVRPWLPQPVEQAQAQLQRVDVGLFWPGGPHTLISGTVEAGPSSALPGDTPGWALRTELTNAIPGPWDLQALPVRELQARVQYQASAWEIEDAQIDLGTGHISAQGRYDTASGHMRGLAQFERLHPAELLSSLDATPLQGKLEVETPEARDVRFVLDIRAERAAQAARKPSAAKSRQLLEIRALQAQGTWQAPSLRLRRLHLDALQATVDSTGLDWQTDTQLLSGQARAQVPGAQLQFQGSLGAQQGKGTARLDLDSATALTQWLARLPGQSDPLGSARLEGQGQLQLQWQGGWAGLQQRLQSASLTSTAPTGLQVEATLQAPLLRWIPAEGSPSELRELQAQLRGSPEQAELNLRGDARSGPQRLALDTRLQGGLLAVRGAAPLDWQARIEQLQARWWQPQSSTTTTANNTTPATAASTAVWQLQLAAPLALSQRTQGQPIRTQRLDVGAGRLQITPPAGTPGPAQVQWEPLLARQSTSGGWGLQSKGQLQGIPLAWVDAFSPDPQAPLLAAAGVSGDLLFNGQWDVDTTGSSLKAQAVLERAAGDLRLAVDDGTTTTMVQSQGPSTKNAQGVTQPQVRRPAGMRARIQQARLQLQAEGQDLRAQLLWNTERAGELTADLRTRLSHSAEGWSWAGDAPLSGQVRARLPNVGIWAVFAPPGWRVAGTLQADASLSGTRASPQWQGQLQADELTIVSLLDGVDLRNGRLRARLQGHQLDITELRLEGGQGSNTRILGYSGNLTTAPKDGGEITATGKLQWNPDAATGNPGIQMDLQARARALQVLVRADRQLSTSGTLRAQLDQGQFVLRGDLTVDRAAILLPEESAPSLGSDVVVRSAATRRAEAERLERERREQSTAQTRKLPDIAVKLDLGRDFALQGHGITTRLRGTLEVRGASNQGGPPRITGEVRTEQGRYRAWGQSLDVETGLIRFNGPYDNPSLDITAIRPNISVRAGVTVTGPVSAPRVALFSEPEMSDAEKLSWVVMGRSTASGGAEAALLQQAALGLLGGSGGGTGFAGKLGLDELGFKRNDGSTDDAGAGAFTLGKRLSQDLYVTYEQSLSGAMGTLYIFYDLSRRLTLRGQTGQQSAVDLIYTRRHD